MPSSNSINFEILIISAPNPQSMMEHTKNESKARFTGQLGSIHLKLTLLAAALSALTSAQNAQAIDIEIKTSKIGSEYIILSGEIITGDEVILGAITSTLPANSFAVLNSPGGDVATAIALGRQLRNAQMNTMVAPRGDCFSACLLSFAGGVKRYVPEFSRLGSHQFRWPSTEEISNATGNAQTLSGSILRHVIAMGIDAEALTYIMETPPNQMFIFADEALLRYNLVTPRTPQKKIIVDRCTGQPYYPEAPEICTPLAMWKNVTVPDFLKQHPGYTPGSPAYIALDTEVKIIQSTSENPYDPEILNKAHIAISGSQD